MKYIFGALVAVIVAGATSAFARNPELTACFYQHSKFEGEATCYEPTFSGETGVRTKSIDFVGDSLNDMFSSMKIGSRLQVRVCEHANFDGACKTFTGGVEYVGNDWNDKISSVEIIPLNASAGDVQKAKMRFCTTLTSERSGPVSSQKKIVAWECMQDTPNQGFAWANQQRRRDFPSVLRLRPNDREFCLGFDRNVRAGPGNTGYQVAAREYCGGAVWQRWFKDGKMVKIDIDGRDFCLTIDRSAPYLNTGRNVGRGFNMIISPDCTNSSNQHFNFAVRE
jgi:hypothetical protein